MLNLINNFAVAGFIIMSWVILFKPTNKVAKFQGNLDDFFTVSFWKQLGEWIMTTFSFVRMLKIGLGLAFLGVMQSLTSYYWAGTIMVVGAAVGVFLFIVAGGYALSILLKKGWKDTEELYMAVDFRVFCELMVALGLSVQGLYSHIPLWKTTNMPELAFAFLMLLLALLRTKSPSWLETISSILASLLLFIATIVFLAF